MYEVEMKFRAPDSERVRQRLVELGGRSTGGVHMVDRYFNHPCRDFAVTDEGLRIREEGAVASVTYKGPLIDRETKTRREIELAIAGNSGGVKFAELLEMLSFREVRAVEKWREKWNLRWSGRAFEVAFDQVAGLGAFIELETESSEEDLANARADVIRLAGELGLKDSERRGYLTLLLEQESGQKNRGNP